MKKLFMFTKVGLLLTLLLAITFPAQAQAIKTEFTGLSYFTNEIIDPGVWTYPDGNVHVRGWTVGYNDVMSDPRVSGTDTMLINFNMQSAPAPVFFSGPMWGTMRVENEGGYWEGSWTGFRDEQGFAYARATLHGHGGYEGLIAQIDATRLSPDYITEPFVFTGVIIDPHGE